MKEKIIRFFKMWTLPLGMFAGVSVYLMFHYISWLSPLKVLAGGAEAWRSTYGAYRSSLPSD